MTKRKRHDSSRMWWRWW